MANHLILAGGTGAHTAVAFLRLHILGYPLGFFDHEGRPFDFPTLYLVDQDAHDGHDRLPTAWPQVRDLVEEHPARLEWGRATGNRKAPELIQVTPLPVGPGQDWFQRPFTSLRKRFEGSPFLDMLTSEYQKDVEYSKGMMGSPAVGALLFRLKEYDERARGHNHDQKYDEILDAEGRIVVVGSGVGGTGASVGPTLAEQLAAEGDRQVMAVMVLEWFELDEHSGDEEVAVKAGRRNRLMRENASSALDYYGRNLANVTATVPVGMPDHALVRRAFTGDVSQPLTESFVHAVAALSSYRHFLKDEPFAPGLYMMGAVEPGRLDGATAIPGGTLQGLANQAATVVELTQTWSKVLSTTQEGRVVPAIYQAVRRLASSPRQVAEDLDRLVASYSAQLSWMEDTLGIKGKPNRSFSREEASRRRLGDDRQPLQVEGRGPSNEEVASALFHWTADWVRDLRSPNNGLVVGPGAVTGGQWPELRNRQGLGVTARSNGDLDRIPDTDRDTVLEAFVDEDRVSDNGWPHPLAAADFFRHAIRREDKVARRQLELLMVGVVSGVLRLEPVHVDFESAPDLSLEALVAKARRGRWSGLCDYKVIYPPHGDRVIGFTSPHTLFAPVPFLADREGLVWNELWQKLTGASDGAFWTEAEERESWGEENDLVIRQICSWFETQKQARRGQVPAWATVFPKRFHTGKVDTPFGIGLSLEVYWGDHEPVTLSLPSSKPGEWVPPEGTPEIDEEALLREVPELLRLEDEGGNLIYEMVEFEVPGREGTVRGWWREHLDMVRAQGHIQLWAWDKSGAVVLGRIGADGLEAVRLRDSRLLDQERIAISRCTPLEQDPAPGSDRPAGDLYPDLPLRADFLDLLEDEDGGGWLRKVAEGSLKADEQLPAPVQGKNHQGERTLTWKLPMRGLGRALRVEVPLSEEATKAHWMVWPRFRGLGKDTARWKAYYVYENTLHGDLKLDTLWTAGSGVRIRRKRPDKRALKQAVHAFPVDYQVAAETPGHTGGPPIALVLRDPSTDEEQGIYTVPLQAVGAVEKLEIQLGVDFGTSHSSAAVKIGEQAAKQVGLKPELVRSKERAMMTVPISEAWSTVNEKSPGIFEFAGWLPTYDTGEGNGFVPSDLVLVEDLDGIQGDDVRSWIPARDFLIPPISLGREDLHRYLLNDFKWDTGSEHFRGQEADLREHYLSHLLELVLAEVVVDHAKGLPRQPISVSFTYPLRARKAQREALEASFRGALLRSKKSTGFDLQMLDGIGMFDESRAAKSSREVFGEVALVADLGGGTLDLYISGKAQKSLPEVADSARLGGNLFLRQIAKSPDGLLPTDGRWLQDGQRDTETKLRAWMRTMGSHQLFGGEAGDAPTLQSMKVAGFKRAADANRARFLLDRYFRLLTEYLARNLAAYLYCHWYPNVPKKNWKELALSVQLRGNGWKLHYASDDHQVITGLIQEAVQQRLASLWELLPENDYPKPAEKASWAATGDVEPVDPKAVTVQGVVGKQMDPSETLERWSTHTMVELELRHETNGDRTVPWFEKIPFQTDNSNQLQINTIKPPVVVSSPHDSGEVAIEKLQSDFHGGLNRKLQDTEGVLLPGQGLYKAPVGPLVWEAIFESKEYWPKD